MADAATESELGIKDPKLAWIPISALGTLVCLSWAQSTVFGFLALHPLLAFFMLLFLAGVAVVSCFVVFKGTGRSLFLLALFSISLTFNFIGFSFRVQHDGNSVSVVDSVPWHEALRGAAGMTARSIGGFLLVLPDDLSAPISSTVEELLPRPELKPGEALVPLYDLFTFVPIAVALALFVTVYLCLACVGVVLSLTRPGSPPARAAE